MKYPEYNKTKKILEYELNLLMILLLSFVSDKKNKNSSDDIISFIGSIENEKKERRDKINGAKLICDETENC